MSGQKGTGCAGCIAVRRILAIVLAVLMVLNTGFVGWLIIIAVFVVLGIIVNIARFI